MTKGALSSVKSEQKVYVGWVEDEGSVVVFLTKDAAEEAKKKNAIDGFDEFEPYGWLPQPQRYLEIGTNVYPDGRIEEVYDEERTTWPWWGDPEYHENDNRFFRGRNADFVRTYGTDVVKVRLRHSERVQELVKKATKVKADVDKLAEALMKSDPRGVMVSQEDGSVQVATAETYEAQARALLATGEVEVASG
jgi:hypothetical protein